MIENTFECIEEYSDILFHKYTNYSQFILTLKNKIIEFKKEKELKNKCEFIFDKYFNDNCKAFNNNSKCCHKIDKNNSKYFCESHNDKYTFNLINILSNVLSHDISEICVNIIFS